MRCMPHRSPRPAKVAASASSVCRSCSVRRSNSPHRRVTQPHARFLAASASYAGARSVYRRIGDLCVTSGVCEIGDAYEARQSTASAIFVCHPRFLAASASYGPLPRVRRRCRVGTPAQAAPPSTAPPPRDWEASAEPACCERRIATGFLGADSAWTRRRYRRQRTRRAARIRQGPHPTGRLDQ